MIPLATTTVTVWAASTPEPYEATSYQPRAASPVPAHISTPSGRERNGVAGGERIDAVLLCDTTVAHGDRVTDDTTGAVYRVAWVAARTGLGLDHTKAGLIAATGEVAS